MGVPSRLSRTGGGWPALQMDELVPVWIGDQVEERDELLGPVVVIHLVETVHDNFGAGSRAA